MDEKLQFGKKSFKERRKRMIQWLVILITVLLRTDVSFTLENSLGLLRLRLQLRFEF